MKLEMLRERYDYTYLCSTSIYIIQAPLYCDLELLGLSMDSGGHRQPLEWDETLMKFRFWRGDIPIHGTPKVGYLAGYVKTGGVWNPAIELTAYGHAQLENGRIRNQMRIEAVKLVACGYKVTDPDGNQVLVNYP